MKIREQFMSVVALIKKLIKKEEITDEDIEKAIAVGIESPAQRKLSKDRLVQLINDEKGQFGTPDEAVEIPKDRQEDLSKELRKYHFPEKGFNFGAYDRVAIIMWVTAIATGMEADDEDIILLISLFGTTEKIVEFFEKYEKEHPGMKFPIYNAVSFPSPLTNQWDPLFWRKLALKYMPSKLFIKVFPHADKIEAFFKGNKEKIKEEIQKRLVRNKEAEIAEEEIETSLDSYLERKMKIFLSKGLVEGKEIVETKVHIEVQPESKLKVETRLKDAEIKEKPSKPKEKTSKPRDIKRKSDFEVELEKLYILEVNNKLNINSRQKPSVEDKKRIEAFNASPEAKLLRETLEKRVMDKFEDKCMDDYIKLQPSDIQEKIEKKIIHDILEAARQEMPDKIISLEKENELPMLEEKIREIDKKLKEKPKKIKETPKISPESVEGRTAVGEPKDLASEKLKEEKNKLKEEMKSLKKRKDEIKKRIQENIEAFHETKDGQSKAKKIKRTAIEALTPTPNEVMANYVATRLKNEEANLSNACKMELRKIYGTSPVSEQGKTPNESVFSSVLSDDIDLVTLYEFGRQCAYTNSNENKKAALIFYESGISEDKFKEYLTWEPEDDPKAIPPIFIDGEDIGYPGYYLKRLNPDDPRIAIAGRKTSCCQFIGGDGQSCAEHAVSSPNGGLYALFERTVPSIGEAVSDQDNMVAQCWAWRSRTIAQNPRRDLVFDSVESQINFRNKNEALITNFFTFLAHRLVAGPYEVGKVVVGKGQFSNTPKTLGVVDMTKEEFVYPDAKNMGLRDSRFEQSVIADREVPYLQFYMSLNPVPKKFVEQFQLTSKTGTEPFQSLSKILFIALKHANIELIQKLMKINRESKIPFEDQNLPRRLMERYEMSISSKRIFKDYIVNGADDEVIKLLIQHCPDIAYEIFYEFATENKPELKEKVLGALQRMIRLGIDVKDNTFYPPLPGFEDSSDFRINPLEKIIDAHLFEIAHFLINAGMEPDQNAFCAALRNNDLPLLKAILEFPRRIKLDLNINVSHIHVLPLHYAINNGQSEVVSLLIAHGADPNLLYQKPILVEHPPVVAAQETVEPGRPPEAKYGVEEDDLVIPSDNYQQPGDTPLMLAIRKSYGRVVESLLKGGADINAVNQSGQTAMAIAKNLNREAIILMLTPFLEGPEKGILFGLELHKEKVLDKKQSREKTGPNETPETPGSEPPPP